MPAAIDASVESRAQTISVSMSENARWSRQRRRRTTYDRRLSGATGKTDGSLLGPMQARAGPIC